MKVFHHRFFLPLGLVVFIGASMFLNTGCSKKSSTSSTPTPAAPTVSLNEPASTYSSGTDSVTVTGTVTDAASVGVSSLKVDSVAVDVTTLTNDSFTVKLEITADTMQVIATLTATDGRVSSDTITVYRTPSGIATGMSMISGTLLKEASTRDRQVIDVNMVARNAEGREKMVRSVIPISGADIMFYDASSVATSSDTSISTDSAGGWSVCMPPGNYFVFAVYFDRTNLEIVTAGLPNIEAIVDKETKTDSATAISDDVNPMLLTFLDASEANSDNMFLASDVPENLPIVMTFSEVMTRVSAGESISGVVLGKTDPDSSDLPMLDTIPVKKLWGPNGKELRLKPSANLTVGATYKVIIPTSIKDLALNKLDNTYYGIFTVISAESLPPFAVSNSSPKSGDTITAGFPVEIIFTRPIDMISLNKKFSITPPSTRSEFKGYFEGKGKIARFVNMTKWEYDSPYTIALGAGTKDLLGNSLGAAYSLTFHIAAQDTFEQKEGVEGQVAAAINKFLGAYIAGDI
ncbi:MAG: Ig-like domain-containing protein, partial [Chitinispirillia bacterium]